MKFENTWGTICDKKSNNENLGKVICLQLGFPGMVKELRNVDVRGRKNVWLANVRCTGTEETMTSCFYEKWGTKVYDCGIEPLGVQCKKGQCIDRSKAHCIENVFIIFVHSFLRLLKANTVSYSNQINW